MTILADNPIPQTVRERAQGPHTLASESDGGYFLCLSDLPQSVKVEHSTADRRLSIRFVYPDHAANEDIGDELWHSNEVDSLRMVAFFSRTKRRLVSVQFTNCDLLSVDEKHLAEGVASAMREPKSLKEGLTDAQRLALKAIAVVFEAELPALIQQTKAKSRE